MELNVIINGEALVELKKLPSDSIDCCITSPPYWALRSYGVAGQLGLEKDFRDYINKLCDIFDEVRRILKPTGTCFVNIGDTYYTKSCSDFSSKNRFNTNTKASGLDEANKIRGLGLLPHKCLVQIPSRFAIEMVDRGWVLRNRIIWYKPSCMPSSTKDRFTNDYEDLFFFTKNSTYFFNTQYEPLAISTIKRYESVIKNGEVYNPDVHKTDPTGYAQSPMELLTRIAKKGNDGNGRIKRTVWAINPQRSKTNHFATFPEKLVETPIAAGCPEFVCNKCGAPRQEIVETHNPEGITGRKGKAMVSEGGVVDTAADGITRIEEGHNPCVYSTAKHVGYTDCGCKSYVCCNCKLFITERSIEEYAIQIENKEKNIHPKLGEKSLQKNEEGREINRPNNVIQRKMLCDVWKRILCEKDANVLFEEMWCQMASSERQSQQLELKKRKESSVEGRPQEIGGLHLFLGSESPECNKTGICDGTPISNGKTPEQIIRKERTSSSQERIEDGQFVGEFASCRTQQPLWRSYVSSLSEKFQSEIKCPFCMSDEISIESSGFSPGIVLDPFMGAGTTGLVAAKQGKKYIGIELNPEYIKLAEQRIHDGLQPIKTKVKKHHVEYPENPFFGL